MESMSNGLADGLAVGEGSTESEGSGETCVTGESVGVGSSIADTTGAGVGLSSLALAGAALSIVKTNPREIAADPNLKTGLVRLLDFKRRHLTCCRIATILPVKDWVRPR